MQLRTLQVFERRPLQYAWGVLRKVVEEEIVETVTVRDFRSAERESLEYIRAYSIIAHSQNTLATMEQVAGFGEVTPKYCAARISGSPSRTESILVAMPLPR